MSPERQSSLVAYLVAGAFFMENFDGTVIVTALPDMAKSFGVNAVDLNIGISAYLMTLAVFILASGWIADRFGARPVFATAITIFTVASMLCGLSNSAFIFTAARVLQGVGGAMMVPVGRLVVLRKTEKRDLMRAIAILTWPGLTAPILGPPIGGLITTYASWRFIFFLNLPLGIVGLILALILIPDLGASSRRPFDWTGFAIGAFACFSLMRGLDLLGSATIPWAEVGLLFATAAILCGIGFRHVRHTPHPLIDFWSLQVKTYAITMGGGLVFRIVTSAVPFLLPLTFQLGFGLDPFHSGLLVLALFAGNFGMKPFTSRILRRFGFRSTIIVNGLLQVATIVLCAFLSPQTPTILIAAVLFASGATRSMQFTAINTIAFVDVPEARMSVANTLFSMGQQLGLGLGVAAGAVALRVAGLITSTNPATPNLVDFRIAFLIIAVLAVFAIADSLSLPATAGEAVSGHGRRSSPA